MSIELAGILERMDEPFSNLDVALRERLCLDVRSILKGIGISALLVTHNQHEAFAMADIIGVMQSGSLEQWDEAYNLYHRPDDIVHDDDSPLKTTIMRKRFRGANIPYTIELQGGEEVLALVSSQHDHAIGQEIGIKPEVDEIILFEVGPHLSA